MRNHFVTICVGTTLLAGCANKSEDSPKLFPTDEVATRTDEVPVTQQAITGKCERVRDLVVDLVANQTHYAPPQQPSNSWGSSSAKEEGFSQAAPSMPTMAEDKAADLKPEPAPDPAPPKVATGAKKDAKSGPSHYTTTNVQERDVDEGDQVKTDGKHIYVLRNNELLIAKTWPVADSRLAARVQFTKLQGQQLYLHGDEVLVQGQSNEGVATRVMVIDVRDRAKPRVRSSFDIDGTAITSRVVGDDIYLVQSAAVQVPQELLPLAQTMLAKLKGDREALRRKLKATITYAQLDAAMPKVRTRGAARPMSCRDLFVPANNTSLGLTGIARISLDSERADYVGAMVSGGQVYASTESLYVTAPGGAGTDVHQFSLAGNNGLPTYVASGSVEGQLLNSFSMSEWRGDLRIATTSHTGNHLFVMRAEGRTLGTIGAVRGLAPGERIYSGRMFGNKGYLVTFRQTDPLYTLDLEDPTNPRVVGELKINGYSSYIHPLGGDLLLTIGQDATNDGRETGMQLQVFDVSNPAKPKRRFQEKLSSWSNYSVSSAQSDHHAFTWDPVKRVLAVPASGTTADGIPFNSLVVYGLDRTRGFTLYGRVTHRALAKEVIDRQCETMDCGRSHYTYQLPQLSQIDRSIVVDNYLLSVGASGFEIHSLDSLSKRAARVMWPLPGTTVEPVAL